MFFLVICIPCTKKVVPKAKGTELLGSPWTTADYNKTQQFGARTSSLGVYILKAINGLDQTSRGLTSSRGRWGAWGLF